MNFQERAPREMALTLSARDLHFSQPPNRQNQLAEIVVVMPLRNQALYLSSALASALEQNIEFGKLAVLILDDQSSDNWREMAHILLADSRVVIAHGVCGSAAHARNALLDLVDLHFPSAKWVARLDADDTFASPGVLRAMTEEGESTGASFVLGSNHLLLYNEQLAESNIADAVALRDPRQLLEFIEAFCHQRSQFELPSCNLVLRARLGVRYPLLRSAEDHWLVSSLLLFRASEVAIVPYPVYCTYRLDGSTSHQNRDSTEWYQTRMRLAQAVAIWCDALQRFNHVLGHGMEGIVWTENGYIHKRFYPWAIQIEQLEKVQRLTSACPAHIVDFEILPVKNGVVVTRYREQPTEAINGPVRIQVLREFLIALWRAQVVVSNISRDNLRLSLEGRLICIDIGADIVPLSVSRFIDCAARAYAVLILEWSDFELARRLTDRREEEALAALPDFEMFYGDLINELHPLAVPPRDASPPVHEYEDVSLLIKCCPQDADSLRDQVMHIVGALTGQTRFARRILTVDPFEGPYLREFDKGNLSALLKAAHRLQDDSWIDEVWIAPSDPQSVMQINARWFDAGACLSTHTGQGAPVVSQVWAFDQVSTRYVLQVDCDVFIGRKEAGHDYLGDMLEAMGSDDVWCVGFNIPKSQSGRDPYAAREEGFVPEVRLGLLDLWRVVSHRPFVNPVVDGKLTLMWHRALELAQKQNGMQSLRGGDSRSFYIHPMNFDKHDPRLTMVRDLVGQGRYPRSQAEQWDLVMSLDWHYPKRGEDLVFLLFGRNTPAQLFKRCIASLQAQTDQEFGIVVVDDSSESWLSQQMPFALGSLKDRTTLIRHSQRQGYLANFRLAVEEICVHSDVLLVVLDQDDALMSPTVVESLKARCGEGADMLHAPMFRPDKPLRRYVPDYTSPRLKGGGNVWAHLRAFRKSLFMAVPAEEWELPNEYFDVLSDYLIMVPMAELSRRPTWIDEGYACFHQRMPYSKERKAVEQNAKQWLATRQILSQCRSGHEMTSDRD